jgi:hypothetical protein
MRCKQNRAIKYLTEYSCKKRKEKKERKNLKPKAVLSGYNSAIATPIKRTSS